MAQRKPLVVTAAGLAELPAADTLPVPAYGIAGPIAGCRIWVGEVVTTATGAWTADLTSAGFTAPPRILAMVLSSDATLANSADADVTARSATAASGFANLPVTIVIGGTSKKRAGAGLTVMVMAIGP